MGSGSAASREDRSLRPRRRGLSAIGIPPVVLCTILPARGRPSSRTGAGASGRGTPAAGTNRQGRGGGPPRQPAAPGDRRGLGHAAPGWGYATPGWGHATPYSIP
ncbi:hypothetical protein JCM13210_05690 [Thermaerobacter litoralis]